MSAMDDIYAAIANLPWDERGTAGNYFDAVTNKWTDVKWAAVHDCDGSSFGTVWFRPDGDDEGMFEIDRAALGSFVASVRDVWEGLSKTQGRLFTPMPTQDPYPTVDGKLLVGWRQDGEHALIVFTNADGVEVGGVIPQDALTLVEHIHSAAYAIQDAFATYEE